MRVASPSGEVWRVRLQWLPRYEGRGLRVRLRQRRTRSQRRRESDRSRWFDYFDLPIVGDSLGAAVVSIAVIICVVLLVMFGLPLLLAAVDLALVLVVAGFGMLGRVAFRRPWIIESRNGSGECLESPVVGWRAARRERAEIANRILHGHPPSP